MNYSDLKADFLGLLKRRDITDSQADSFLTKAVNRVQRTLRTPPQEKSIAITYDGVSFTNGQLPIPNDYLRLIAMTATPPSLQEAEVDQADLQSVLSLVPVTGERPLKFCRRGGYWQFAPLPAAGTVMRIDYYDEFPAFTPTMSNYLTNGAADLIVYGALTFAGDYFSDKRTPGWEQRFQSIVMEIEDQSQQDALMNSSMAPAYYFPEDC